MPKPLVNLSITSPGFFGLNKQESGSILPMGWATDAYNLVFDSLGRPASRKGYKYLNASAISGTPSVRASHEYIDASGNTLHIIAAGNKIYKVVGSSLTDITGTITTPTADNWKFVNFNGKCLGFQSGHAGIVLSSVAGSFANISYTGTYFPSTAVDAALVSNGYVWVLDGSDLRYSALLDETTWEVAGPLPNVFDLSSYWKDGMDKGTALAEWNGYLVVFGTRSIIIYANPYDPASTMQIAENIGGVGCIARDSVQAVGTDMLFLSHSGVRSLGRVIQEKSLPVRDISKNVRSYLVNYALQETAANIKSAYSESEGLYTLSLPSSGKTFAFDIRFPMQDGTYKVTEWSIAPTALSSNISGDIFMGWAGYISKYQGYQDNVASDGTGGSSYRLRYYGPWNDFGEEVGQFLKIPKKFIALMGGVAGRTVTVKWAFDYVDQFESGAITFPVGTVAYYGIATYTVSTYSGLLTFDQAKTNMNQAGQAIKIGIEVDTDGSEIVIQRFDIFAKVGRYAQ